MPFLTTASRMNPDKDLLTTSLVKEKPVKIGMPAESTSSRVRVAFSVGEGTRM